VAAAGFQLTRAAISSKREAQRERRVGLKRTPSGWEVYFTDLLIGTLSANDNGGIQAVRYEIAKPGRVRKKARLPAFQSARRSRCRRW
jgi:hypothetical protein